MLHHVMLVSSVRFHPRSPVPSPPESGLSVTAHLAPSPSSPSPSPSGDHRPAVCVYEFIAFGFPATQAWNQVVPVRFHLTHFAGREAPASSRADAPGSAPPLLTVVPPHEEHPSPPRCVSRAARGDGLVAPPHLREPPTSRPRCGLGVASRWGRSWAPRGVSSGTHLSLPDARSTPPTSCENHECLQTSQVSPGDNMARHREPTTQMLPVKARRVPRNGTTQAVPRTCVFILPS